MNEVDVAARNAAVERASRHPAVSRSASLSGLVCAAALLVASATARAESPPCRRDDAASPHLRIETSAGPMEIRLYPEAAPNAVAGLTDLVSGGLADEQSAQASGSAHYYDGLTFDYTRPHVEIRTSGHTSVDVAFAQEIDADALGLHEERITTAGEAMNAMQDEVLPAFRRARRTGTLSPRLEHWLEAWYEHYAADFLIGVSRKEINEALGYPYTQGPASRPVTKGSVALTPRSARSASPILSIALSDLPRRTGKWMVVGEVVHGLDLADRISSAPLDKPKHVRSRTYRPRDPVVIESVRLACR